MSIKSITAIALYFLSFLIAPNVTYAQQEPAPPPSSCDHNLSGLTIVNGTRTITAPGVWCPLLSSLAVVNIQVSADNVTLDFQGHQINGSVTVQGSGFTMRNGTVKSTGSALTITNSQHITIENMRFRQKPSASQHAIVINSSEFIEFRNNVVSLESARIAMVINDADFVVIRENVFMGEASRTHSAIVAQSGVNTTMFIAFNVFSSWYSAVNGAASVVNWVVVRNHADNIRFLFASSNVNSSNNSITQ